MKTLKSLFTVTVLFLALISAKASNSNGELIALPQPFYLKPTASAPVYQALILARQPAVAYGHDDDMCSQYKRREIAGFVLLPVGVGLAVGGPFMIYHGVTDISNNVNAINNGERQGAYVPKHDIVLVSAGAAMAIVGFVLVPTGLGMGISGAVRYRRHCGTTRSFYIAPSAQGTGVACRF